MSKLNCVTLQVQERLPGSSLHVPECNFHVGLSEWEHDTCHILKGGLFCGGIESPLG